MAQASSGATSQAAVGSTQMELYSQEEKQYLRISTLVLKTGTRALRSFFDTKLPPNMLQHTLNIQTNKDKLQRLKSRRTIHASQWDTLYPPIGGVVSSTNFDITLMSLLLQEIGGIIAPITGWGTMPGGGDQTEGADIVRLRMYRNEMAHNNAGVISNIDFQTKSTDIRQVIVRLGGAHFTTEINRILTCAIDETDRDLWREVRLELQEMKNEIVELKDKELKSQEISSDKLSGWTEDDKTFYATIATKRILEHINKEASKRKRYLIVGLPGAGKTANCHHIALQLKNNGYRLCCIGGIKELIDKTGIFEAGEKQVYVINDVFGVHGVNDETVKEWTEKHKDDIERCLNKPNVILLCSSRVQVVNDKKLSNIIKSYFTVINISEVEGELSSEGRSKERVEIFRKHASVKERVDLLKDEVRLTDEVEEKIQQIECTAGCFPLMCRLYVGDKEIKQTIEEYFNKPLDQIQEHIQSLQNSPSDDVKLGYFCLLMCMIYDNNVPMNTMKVGKEEQEIKNKRHELLELCELPTSTSRQTIHKKMETLLQTFIKREGDNYQFVHDIIHDAVIKHVNNLSSSVHQVIMSHCSSKFMMDRVHLSGVVCMYRSGRRGHDTEPCINIRSDSFTCWGDRVLDIVRDGVRTSDQLYNDINEGRCSRDDRRVVYDNPWSDVFRRNRCVHSTEGQTAIVQALDRKSPSDVQTLMCTDGYSLSYNKPRHTALHWSIEYGLTHIVRQTLSMISTTRLRQLDSTHRYGLGLLSWAVVSRNTDMKQMVRQKLQEGQDSD